MKGRGNAAWIAGPSCAVPSQKIATWSAERRAGLIAKARGRLQKAPRFCAVSALRSLTHVRGRKKEKALPRACWEGADDARLYQC